MKTPYDDLTSVAEIMKERALEDHRIRVADRRAVDEEIAQIDAMRLAVQQDGNADLARRSIGGDTLWQSWLVNRRTEMLQRSAMARALEGESLALAKVAFARAQAAQDLQKTDIAARQRNLAQKRAEEMERLGMLFNAQMSDDAGT